MAKEINKSTGNILSKTQIDHLVQLVGTIGYCDPTVNESFKKTITENNHDAESLYEVLKEGILPWEEYAEGSWDQLLAKAYWIIDDLVAQQSVYGTLSPSNLE